MVTEAFTGNALELDNIMPDRMFSFIFVDAPCSGMLKAAAGHVAPGGALAYSTCTVTREENAGVVKAFLDSEEGADFTLDQLCGRNCLATRLAPGSSDAHFAVRFVRKPQE